MQPDPFNPVIFDNPLARPVRPDLHFHPQGRNLNLLGASRTSWIGVEAFHVGTPSVRVSSVSIEAFSSGPPTPVRVTSVALEVFRALGLLPYGKFHPEWPNPLRPRYPIHDPGGQNPNLFPPPPVSVVDFPNPIRPRPFLYVAADINVALLAALPFTPTDFPNPVYRAARQHDPGQSGRALTAVNVVDDGYTYVVF